ncbi:MAG TPA: hypothetical protein VGW77_01510 [Candidatus Binatia bacterium]|jgi:hypothetical protein|nr:hypothetical protein [Candidatus Binatia bacterium]
MKNEEVATPLRTIRLALFSILLIGMLGSGIELILLSHYDDWRQWLPVILILLGLSVSGWHAVRSTALSVRLLQALFICFMASGFAGIYFHYQGGAEFKLESNPSLRGWALFWETIRGKVPPLLAPGVMVQFGLLGLVYTHRHPALNRSNKRGEEHVT